MTTTIHPNTQIAALFATARGTAMRITTAIQAMVVAMLLLLTLADVETDIGHAELWLARAVLATLALGFGASIASGRALRLTAIDAVVTAWWVAQATRCYLGEGVFTPRAFWAFTEAALLYAGLRLIFAAGRPASSLVVAGIMGCCLYESALGIHQLITDTSRHGLYPVTGTFLNPGPYSAYLAVGVAVAMGLRHDMHSRLSGEAAIAPMARLARRGAALLTVPALAMMAAAWSRAAWVAVGFVAASLYWKRLAGCKHKYAIVAALMACALAAYLLKQGSADGRVVMWLGAMHAIADHPWLGAGIGGFGGAYAGGVASLFDDGGAGALLASADVADNAYNEWLTIGVEQGLSGMTAMAAVTTMVLMRLGRSSRPLMCGLLALVVFAMFSYPLHCQPYRILFVLLCAWAASPPATTPPWRPGPPATRLSPKVWLWQTMVAIVLTTLAIVARVDTERRVAASEDYRLMAGVDATYLIDDYYELLPLMDDNERFLFDFGKALSDLGRPGDSNAMLRRGAALSADPMFLVLMGNNYRAMDMPAEAERCYLRAFSVMPNRIYPLFRLMKLYEEQGRHHDCLRMAHRVAEFKVKIPSQATRQIKIEANDIIKKRQ